MNKGIKILLWIFGLPMGLFVATSIIFRIALGPTDHFYEGALSYKYNNFYTAEEKFQQVDKSHANYDSAQIYLQWTRVKLDSARKQASKKLDAPMTELSHIIRATNRDFKQILFSKWALKMSGRRCEITVADSWYYAERFQKERILDAFYKTYSSIAVRHKLLRDEYDVVTVSLLDVNGLEVAYYSSATGSHIVAGR